MKDRSTAKFLRNALPGQPAPRLASPTMYLVRLRSHLSQGKIALGEVIDAVSDVLPTRARRKRPLR